MPIYDQNQTNITPWYGQTNTYTPVNQPRQPQAGATSAVPHYTTNLNQFVWVNGPGMVDMWPVAAGSEMTFIDNEAMMLYVKRVDEYNHPLKTRRFKLTEMTDETESVNSAPAPTVDVDGLKQYLNNEIDKRISDKMSTIFSIKLPEDKEAGNV